MKSCRPTKPGMRWRFSKRSDPQKRHPETFKSPSDGGGFEMSEKPFDFANASPFPSRKKEKDPAGLAILAAGAFGILVFLLSMLNLLRLHGPM